MPDASPDAQCPQSSAVELDGIPAEAALRPFQAVGDVPVYIALPAVPRSLDFFPPTHSGWRTARILILSKPGYRGPVLLRGRQLDGGRQLRLRSASGTPTDDLHLRAGPWDETKSPLTVWRRMAHPEAGWRVARADVLVRVGGCYGVQVEGESFSYVIPFYAVWQH